MSNEKYDNLVWEVTNLSEFQDRLKSCGITEYEGVCEPKEESKNVIVRMNWVRFKNGRERGEKRGSPEKAIYAHFPPFKPTR